MSVDRGELAGAFTLAAARRSGFSASAVDRRVRRGEWTRLHPGVFHPTGADALTRAAAVVLASGGVASHLAAARVHDLWVVDEGDWATVDPSVHRRSTARLRFHRGRLAPGDITAFDDVPVTTVMRTLLDLCRDCTRLQAVVAIESAARRWMITPHELWCLRHHGDRRVSARALEADPRSESPLETAVRLLAVDAGIAVTPQWRVVDDRGAERYRIDLVVDGTRVGIECDGREVHDQPSALYRDRRRANDLAGSWVLLRFTWYDVLTRPDYVVASIRAAVARLAS